MSDNVNHPSHYTAGGIECIDALEAMMTPEAFEGYLQGNVVKYLWRYKLKGHPREDLHKAQWYLDRLAKHQTTIFERSIDEHLEGIDDGDRQDG